MLYRRERAQHIFKEALRCSYDNPKIWENYLVVSETVWVSLSPLLDVTPVPSNPVCAGWHPCTQ